MNLKKEFNSIGIGSNKNFCLAVLFTTIILFLYCYFGSYSFFEKYFTVQNLQYWKIIYHNTMSFILFFCLGLIYSKFFIKNKNRDLGLSIGNHKLGLILVCIAIPVAIICGLSCVLDKGMNITYPLIDFNKFGEWYYIVIYFVSYLLYYIGWEFLFRGILFFNSEKTVGVLGAILITTLISALIHTSIAGFGKPMIETLSAIVAGLFFGYIAFKTRSIFYTIIIHMLIGFSTDIFIFLLVH